MIGRCCPDQDDLPAAIHAAKAAITWRRERENFGRWSTFFVFLSFLCIMSYNGNLYHSLNLIFLFYIENIFWYVLYFADMTGEATEARSHSYFEFMDLH